jgi:hypothetical protein
MDKAIIGRQKIIETPVRYRIGIGLNLKRTVDMMWRIGESKGGSENEWKRCKNTVCTK